MDRKAWWPAVHWLQRFRHDFVTKQQQMTSVTMAGVGVYVLRESEMGLRPGS